MIKNKERFKLIIFLSTLNVFPALTTDMYLPALPSMAKIFNAPMGILNLTLVLFFISYSLSMLLWGPLSDKYGRKPVLITGMTIYVFASLGCALSSNIYQLLLARVFQGVSAASAISVSMAITKDVFEARTREKVLAVIGVLMMIGPVAAPIIGAWLLKLGAWRIQFIILFVFGLIELFLAITMKETIAVRSQFKLIATVGRFTSVLKNRSFAYGLFLFAFISSPFLIFLGLSSSIFVNHFNINEQMYSYYLASAAIFSGICMSMYVYLAKFIPRFKIITLSLMIVICSGILIILFGNQGPITFTAMAVIGMGSFSMIRVPSMNLLLEQITHDIGTATSLISCSFMTIGSLMMALTSAGWGNLIYIIGIADIVIGSGCLFFWTLLVKKNILIDTLAITPKEEYIKSEPVEQVR